MHKQMLIVADRVQARFFRLDDVDFPEYQSGPKLVELEQIYNADVLISDRRGVETPLKIHAGPQRVQREKLFARQISSRATKMAQQNHCSNLIISAESQMLGYLRLCTGEMNKNGIHITEIDKGLSRFGPKKIHGILSNNGILPAQRRPSKNAF